VEKPREKKPRSRSPVLGYLRRTTSPPDGAKGKNKGTGATVNLRLSVVVLPRKKPVPRKPLDQKNQSDGLLSWGLRGEKSRKEKHPDPRERGRSRA